MSVIEFKRPESDEVCEPHLSGIAVCAACRHEWVAAVPAGVDLFECPGCHTHKGRMKHDCLPASGVVWECGCGCDMFRITGSETMCVNCGKGQVF